MYVFIYLFIIYLFIVYLFIYLCMYVYMYLCIYVSIYLSIYMYVYVCKCMHMYVYVCKGKPSWSKKPHIVQQIGMSKAAEHFSKRLRWLNIDLKTALFRKVCCILRMLTEISK